MEESRPHLPQIVGPSDLHRLTDKELQELSNEVRQAILNKVSKTGGHFSSNLGTVELTVALYATFTVPPDKVVWDTGHQAYPHKLLTGRLDRFDTLRKHGGLSGFLRREEHELDIFGAGHAGTAISAAMGFAAARDLLGSKERVVAVTGDASISTGMSWEALNHVGDLGTNMTVVLNDNRMSIAPNVGALTNYLSRLRSRSFVQKAARRAKDVIERMPEPFTRMASGLRHGITHYMAPEDTGTIFEEIGFEYIGPVDGHDLSTLLEVFRNVREMDYPVLVHALTVKGKGYEVAEEDSRKWHGVIPFDLTANEMMKASGQVTYTQAFGAVAIECAEADPRIVAITAAMPDGTGLTAFSQQFPKRYFDTGIAEQHAVTLAAGMAAGGIKPMCAIYSTFLQRGFDQVLHDVCLQNLPVRFFMDRAGLVGDDGPTHHGVFDIAYLSPIPNMVLLAPRDTTELQEMTRWMMNHDDGPTAVRYPRGSSDERLPESRTPISLGKAEVLLSPSNPEVLLIGIGSTVAAAFDAAQTLAGSGLRAAVLNARFAKPLDSEAILRLARSAGRVVVVEEGVKPGGFGEAVRTLLCEAGLDIRTFASLAIPDAFIEHGPQSVLRAECGIDAPAITAAARALCAKTANPS